MVLATVVSIRMVVVVSLDFWDAPEWSIYHFSAKTHSSGTFNLENPHQKLASITINIVKHQKHHTLTQENDPLLF